MKSIIKSQRTILLIVGLLLTTVTILLIGAASTSIVIFVDDDLQAHWRTTYDILVRPRDSQSPVEKKHGLVEANYLSQLERGISFEQYQTVATLPDIEVAAPIALLTYIQEGLEFGKPFPRVEDEGIYLYESILTTDGLQVGAEVVTTHQYRYYHYFGPTPVIQVTEPILLVNQPVSSVNTPVVLLFAAIDPPQEAKLIDLEQAIRQGSYLTGNEPIYQETISLPYGDAIRVNNVPVLINATHYTSFTLFHRLSQVLLPPDVLTLDTVIDRGGVEYLATLPLEVIAEGEESVAEAYPRLVEYFWQPRRPGSVLQYYALNDSLQPVIRNYQEVNPSFPHQGLVLELEPPPLSQGDSAPAEIMFNLKAHGVFDIEHIPPPLDVNRVPMEIYYPPVVVLRYDDQGQPVTPRRLQPMLGPGSYVLSPPMALTTLEAARAITGDDCARCISAIRVRVAGIDELTPAAQRKIETIAGEIVRLTGLDVDIMVGSSPTRILVHVPGVGYVEEQWIQKNVTATYQERVQTGHLILLAALLGIGGLFVLDLAWADVVARRRTIALQKALGWRSTTIFSQILGHLLLVGLLATTLGALLAWSITRLSGWEPLSLSLLAGVPLLIITSSLLGGLYPAWLAARVPPIVGLQHGSIQPATGNCPGRSFFASARSGQAPLPSAFFFLAWRGLTRRWSRSALGALTAALSAALLVLMLAGTVDQQGAMSGTLLGEFILVRIEGYHYAIVGIGFGLAALSLANSLLAGVLERRREIGVLKAVGWHTVTVARLFLLEGGLLGLLGGLAGTVLGLAIFANLYDETVSLSLGLIGLVGVLTPIVVGALAALYPARVAARIPPAEAVRYE